MFASSGAVETLIRHGDSMDKSFKTRLLRIYLIRSIFVTKFSVKFNKDSKLFLLKISKNEHVVTGDASSACLPEANKPNKLQETRQSDGTGGA